MVRIGLNCIELDWIGLNWFDSVLDIPSGTEPMDSGLRLTMSNVVGIKDVQTMRASKDHALLHPKCITNVSVNIGNIAWLRDNPSVERAVALPLSLTNHMDTNVVGISIKEPCPSVLSKVKPT